MLKQSVVCPQCDSNFSLSNQIAGFASKNPSSAGDGCISGAAPLRLMLLACRFVRVFFLPKCKWQEDSGTPPPFVSVFPAWIIRSEQQVLVSGDRKM